ncbi:MAG TPA: outer membrane lipoprotein carrier protein LolA [Chitinophagaceae bacterium]|nr:outer membrane lipoprotein carrier protein LolA [Chitinophagaceae bacterium]
MPRLFLAVSFSVLTFSLLAQGSNDPAAKQVLDAVSARFKTFKTVQAGFTYKVEDAKGKAMSTKTGTIWMKGTKYKVVFGGQEIYSDGATIWNYDKNSKEVSINSVDPNSSAITPQKLFTNFYDQDFLYKLNGEKKIGAKTIQEIEMTPTEKEGKKYHKVYLQIDKAAKTIYSTKVLNDEGNKYVYTVSSMKTNGAMADTMFVFDKKKYPGVEEVDLR